MVFFLLVFGWFGLVFGGSGGGSRATLERHMCIPMSVLWFGITVGSWSVVVPIACFSVPPLPPLFYGFGWLVWSAVFLAASFVVAVVAVTVVVCVVGAFLGC